MGEEVLSAASTELLATSLRTSSCKHVYWALHDVPSYVSSPSTCDVELKDYNIVGRIVSIRACSLLLAGKKWNLEKNGTSSKSRTKH